MSDTVRDGQSTEPKLGPGDEDIRKPAGDNREACDESVAMASREEARVRLSVERLMFCYNAGQVRRWHARTHVIRQETIASHTWSVVMLILLLHPNPSKELIYAAMVHDVPEFVTGDIPRWFKDYEGVRNLISAAEEGILSKYALWHEQDLVPEDLDWLKAADLFDAWMFLRQNLLAGNQLVTDSYHRATAAMLNLQGPNEILEVFYVLKAEKTYD
jgi:HD domain-containing protein